jgi:isopentenyl diphosphate isomerase/L-lactate dehydrogenase-like FMN-dependent dehydrogenase
MWSQTPAGRLDVKKGFSEEQIIGFLREGDRGVPVPVLVDGGVRRGPDVFKALALGATAVGIGRPQAWGLAAFGHKGVEAVLAIYDRELRVIMRQAGTPDIASINAGNVISHLA